MKDEPQDSSGGFDGDVEGVDWKHKYLLLEQQMRKKDAEMKEVKEKVLELLL
jgi:hypothetical protein